MVCILKQCRPLFLISDVTITFMETVTILLSAISIIVPIFISYGVYKLGIKDKRKIDYFERIVECYYKIENLRIFLDNPKANDREKYLSCIEQRIKILAILLCYYLSRYPDKPTDERTNFKHTALAIAHSPINSKNYQELAKYFADFCFSVNKNELKDDKIRLFGEQEIIFKH